MLRAGAHVKCPHGTPRRRYASASAKQQKDSRMFDKILIANRGEIACRVIRTARALGIKTVAVYSEADAGSLHVKQADEAFLIGPAAVPESYLKAAKILEVARKTGAQAIHPGYGFLSENANFSEECARQNIVFIGPPASAIRAMGSKSSSKTLMKKANVPVVPGYHGTDQSLANLTVEAEKIGYPVIIKAWHGGGGKGMKIVERRADLEEALSSAIREAKNSFGNDQVLIEKYIKTPRHVEVQVFADTHGNAIHLFERDCSVQRRHQKIIEEAPAPLVDAKFREKIGATAVAAAKAVGYVNAGTCEFILDTSDKNFYFMEMNTRLQVEHPITEMITKQDLVHWQLKVAAGEPLPLQQSQVQVHGHAFEARIYAENPANNFLPDAGTIAHLHQPQQNLPHVRIDTGVLQGDQVGVYYDPMIAKLIVWDSNREQALRRLRNSLGDFQVVGFETNIEFLKRLAANPAFAAGDVETGFIAKRHGELFPEPAQLPPHALALAMLYSIESEKASLGASAGPWQSQQLAGWRLNSTSTRPLELFDRDSKVSASVTYTNDGALEFNVRGQKMPAKAELKDGVLHAEVNGVKHTANVVLHNNKLHIFSEGQSFVVGLAASQAAQTDKGPKSSLLAPMPGKVIKIVANVGEQIKKGQPLIILEAMKMEHVVRAPYDGEVKAVLAEPGQMISQKTTLINFVPL